MPFFSHLFSHSRYVPYPFQNNLSVLDVEDQIVCLNGLIDASLHGASPMSKKPSNFDEWMAAVMGAFTPSFVLLRLWILEVNI